MFGQIPQTSTPEEIERLAKVVAALSYPERLALRDAIEKAGVCLKCWDTNCTGWCDYSSPDYD